MRRPHLPKRTTHKELLSRISDLEDKISKLEDATYEPEGFTGLQSLISGSIYEGFWGVSRDDKKPRTQVQQLQKKFDAAMAYLKVSVQKESSRERYVARYIPPATTKKKATKK